MDHRGQALQGQLWEPRALGFRGGPAAPRSQNREQVLNRVRGDGEKAILLEKYRQSDSPVIGFSLHLRSHGLRNNH